MRDFKVQAKAEIDEVQAHIGRIQQCLNVYAQAPDRIGLIRDVSSPEKEFSTNVFRAISAADDSHQILVSTSGSPVHAQNISAGPRSSQWMGQMSEASLQLLSKDVRATHGTIHNSVDKSTRN
jgi:hypothetical protein